ncbi:MAG: hypothetical protein KGO96_03700 [Elusimicrobia bacterium]|nr:hypothetical protein [Elusimicrobiota bacterium]MDE2424997.1 hypothetical protein [Elusimicrobiota bacterium]
MRPPTSAPRAFRDLMARSRVPSSAARRSLEVMGGVSQLDPLGLTRYEMSVKFKAGRALPTGRFLNMDADGYSCRDGSLFLERLKGCCGIARAYGADTEALRLAMGGLAETPVDLYFGSEIDARSSVFGFWLIWGGVDRKGRVRFCPHDYPAAAARCLAKLGCARPRRRPERMLNLGFDLLGDRLVYKCYYLVDAGTRPGPALRRLRGAVERRFGGFEHFLFFSEMREPGGAILKEKLFIEFREDVLCGDEAALGRACAAIAAVLGREADASPMEGLLRSKRLRLSLVSFEPDGAVTAYLRALPR